MITLNTLKTIFGFIASLFKRYMPFRPQSDSVDAVYNYLLINENLATSGQPTEEQFHLIQQAGYKHVINLAPNSFLENSLKNEASLVNALGMEYLHIPVDFKGPKDSDFNRFVTGMQGASNDKVWVHCAANMRVSAFIYKYRCQVLNEDRQHAEKDLHQIWEPYGVWENFIEKG